MQKIKIIKRLEKYGCILARNKRPIFSIMCMAEYVNSIEKEKYVLEGYLYGRPILRRIKK